MSDTVTEVRPIFRVLVDAPELLSDVVATLAPGDDVVTDLVDAPLDAAPDGTTLRIVHGTPSIARVVELGDENRGGASRELLCVLGADARLLAIGPALALPTFDAVGPALAAARFVHAVGGFDPDVATRGLGAVDRARVGRIGDRGPRLVRVDDGFLGLASGPKGIRIGRPDDVGRALEVLGRTSLATPPSLPRVEGADRDASLDVLVGPSRTLSDPASKSALEPYDLPLPIEELCATASRAAAESQRIGFPVRISLASPDVRPSQHPELVVEGVEGGARVRDAFRELVAFAERTNPTARILGVTVGASTLARSLVRIEVERVARRHLVATIGFADPHGRASGDSVYIPLPAEPAAIGSTIMRLRASALFGSTSGADGVVTRLTDVVLRTAAFLDDFVEEADRVGLDPVAILEGGDIEVREAYVHVTDAFTRRLDRG